MSQTVIAESIASLNLLGYTEARPHACAFPYSVTMLLLALTMMAGIGGTIVSWFTSGIHVTFSCLEATQLVNFNNFFIGTCQCNAADSLVSVNLSVFPFHKVNTAGCDLNGANCQGQCTTYQGCYGDGDNPVDGEPYGCIPRCYNPNNLVYDHCYLSDYKECYTGKVTDENYIGMKLCKTLTAHIPSCMADGASLVDYCVSGDHNCGGAEIELQAEREKGIKCTHMSNPDINTKDGNACSLCAGGLGKWYDDGPIINGTITRTWSGTTATALKASCWACNNQSPLPPSEYQSSREPPVFKKPCLRKGLIIWPSEYVAPLKDNAYAIIDMQCINGVCFPNGK